MNQVVRAALWSGLICSTADAQAQEVEERPWRLRGSYGVAVNERAHISTPIDNELGLRATRPGLWRLNIGYEHKWSKDSFWSLGFGSTGLPTNMRMNPGVCMDSTGAVVWDGGEVELPGAETWIRVDVTGMMGTRLLGRGRHVLCGSAGLGVSIPTLRGWPAYKSVLWDVDDRVVEVFALYGRYTEKSAVVLCGELSYSYALGRSSTLDLRAFASYSGATFYSGQYVAMPGTSCETTGTWEQGLSYVSLNLGYSYRFHRKKRTATVSGSPYNLTSLTPL